MTYTSTTEQHGREQVRVDVARWATDLAKELGGTALPDPECRSSLDTAEIALADDIRLRIYWTSYRTPKQIKVTGSHTRVKELHRGRWPSGLKFPSIHVTVERDMTAIARDVVRRVFVPSRTAGEKLIEAIVEEARTLGRLSRRVDELRALFPLLQVEISARGDGASLYLNTSDAADIPFFSGALNTDGAVYVDRLGSMNAARFERVMRALTEDLS